MNVVFSLFFKLSPDIKSEFEYKKCYIKLRHVVCETFLFRNGSISVTQFIPFRVVPQTSLTPAPALPCIVRFFWDLPISFV